MFCKITIFLIIAFVFLTHTKKSNSQWQQTGPDSCLDMTVKDNIIFATLGYYSGVWKSTNYGTNWISANNGLSFVSPNNLCNDGTNIFARYSGVIYKSTNEGVDWFISYSGINAVNTIVLEYNDISGKLYAGCNPGLYVSSNSGTNWNLLGLDTIRVNGIDFYENNTMVIVGNSQQFLEKVVLISTNSGNSWSNITGIIGNSNHSPRDVKILGQNIYVNAVSNLYRKNISGGSWVSLNNNGFPNYNIEIEELFVIDQSLLVAIEDWDQPLFISHNGGQSFTDISQGIFQGVGIYVKSVVSLNNYAFAGTYSSHPIYKRPLSEIIGINLISTEIPKQFALYQNYPNPFNPLTTISFDLLRSEKVSLSVYDIQGRESRLFENQELSAGSYKYEWNATNYASGIFFYRLETKDFIETKKMILVK